MRIGYCTCSSTILGLPLECARWTLRQLPFESEQVFEKVIAPFCWCRRPCTFKSTGDRMNAMTIAKRVSPSKTLFFKTCSCGHRTDMFVCIGSSVSFAKGVTTCNQCHGFLIIHCHPSKSFADVASSGDGIRFAVRTLRIHINQSHLHSSQRVFKF